MKKSPGKSETQKSSFEIPKDLWRRAKVRALEEGRPLQDVIAAALELYLARQKKGGPDAR